MKSNSLSIKFSLLKKFRVLTFLACCLVPLSALAQTKVVVIPLSGADLKPLKNVISVAKQNGDFSDPSAAVASITDASESNPYLVVIAPGVYNMANQLVLKEFVEVAGSGKSVTFLRINAGSNDSEAAAAAVVAGPNTSLRDVTVQNLSNTQSGSVSIGVFSQGNTLELNNVDIQVENFRPAAIYGQGSCSYKLNNVVIALNQQFATATGVELRDFCRLTMRGGSVDVRADSGFISRGFDLVGTGKVSVSDVNINVSGGLATTGGSSVYGFDVSASQEVRLANIRMLLVSQSEAVGISMRSSNEAVLDINGLYLEIFASGDSTGVVTQRVNTDISDSKVLVTAPGPTVLGIERHLDSGSTRFNVASSVIEVRGSALSTVAVGVRNQGLSGPMTIRNSKVLGQANSVEAASTTQPNSFNNVTYISDTLLSGEVVGEPKCDFVIKNGVELDSSCSSLP